MINTIQLPAQDVFTIQREIAGMVMPLTMINYQMYFSEGQALHMAGVNHVSGFRRHVEAVIAEENLGGELTVPPLHCTVYTLPLQFRPMATVGGNGDIRPMRFYHTQMVFRVALRTHNRSRQSAIVNWLFDVGNVVVQEGFCIDQTAYQHDPSVAARLREEIARLRAGLTERGQLFQAKQSQLAEATVRYSNVRDYGIEEE